MIEAKYLHKKVKEWKPLSEYADLFGMTVDQMRDCAMENMDVGYLNVQGEYIGPCFESNPFVVRAGINPPFEMGVMSGPIKSTYFKYFTYIPNASS